MLIQEELKIITIRELLKIANLQIPNYQRPYKWTEKNVNQLIDDILFHSDKSAYRLGMLVLHKDERKTLNIVDGQQRIITIFLLAYALHQKEKLPNYINIDFSKEFLPNNEISKYNIKQNYNVIVKRVNEFDNTKVDFFLNKCELVKVVIDEVAEAFQFFDSQNARGKALYPHDLLKAFHLRQMRNSSESERREVVEKWENIDGENLMELLGKYLFRIKKWIRAESADYFSKNDIDIFKGVTLEAFENQHYPFIKVLKISDCYTEKQNKLWKVVEYSFQIDQVIINGRRFFEMIIYYDKLRNFIENCESNGIKKYIESLEIYKAKSNACNILKTLDTYDGHGRAGDGYVRNLFDCALFYYVDKFGKVDLDKVTEKVFIWTYSLRLKNERVLFVTIDNTAKSTESFFRKVHYAVNHREILNWRLDSVKEIKATKVDDVKKLFEGLGYA